MNFEKEVLEESKIQPIVVDFWAPWCGPCQSLGPIIELLADEANGRWKLVKVNTDDHPELMQQYGIRSIPAVKMFHEGNMISEFSGLMPKHEIEKWLDQNIPDPRLEELEQIRENEGKLKLFIEQYPDLTEAKVALLRLMLFDQPEESLAMAQSIPAGIKYFDELETYKQIAKFLSLADPDDQPVAKKVKAAQEAAKAGNHQQAVALLIESIVIDKSYHQEIARLAIISYFQYLGKDHEVTQSLRKRFDMALY